jgi:hypothetical protein
MNPKMRSTLIFPTEFKPKDDWRILSCFYRRLGVSEEVISKLERCCKYFRAIENFDACNCETQIHPEHCGITNLCVACANRERKKLASEMVSYIRKLYLVADQKLRCSDFEFTLPDSESIFVGNDLNLLRQVAVETIYEWLGYDSKKITLALDVNVDVWHSDRIWKGNHPHVHATVYSWVRDLRAREHSFTEKVGNWATDSDLDRLRFLWRKNVQREFGFHSSSKNWVVHYSYIDEEKCGNKVAYAKLALRLRYMYRSPIVDFGKFVHSILIDGNNEMISIYRKFEREIVEVVSGLDYGWIGRLMNFYGRARKGQSGKFKHVQRFGLIADRVQKKYGNELALQYRKEPNFKSPSERAREARKYRCKRHAFSRGEIVACGMTIDEVKKKFPKCSFVGRVIDRDLGEFWKVDVSSS